MKRFILLFLFAAMLPAGMFAQAACQTEIQNNENEATLDVAPVESGSVHFFINPVTNLLQLTPTADLQNALLVISDTRGRVVGKEVFRDMPAGQAGEFQMNDYSPGIYVFVLQGANFRYSEKIMVQ